MLVYQTPSRPQTTLVRALANIHSARSLCKGESAQAITYPFKVRFYDALDMQLD